MNTIKHLIFILSFFASITTFASVTKTISEDNNEISTAATSIFSGGTGSTDDPYVLTTAHDLIFLSNNDTYCSKHFIQVNDISFLSPSGLDTLWIDENSDGIVTHDEIDYDMSGELDNGDVNGFIPIGTSDVTDGSGVTLTGSYSGWDTNNETFKSHIIDNLYINRPNIDKVGFFRKVGTNKTVRNIDFTNGYVVGKDYVGMCCGEGICYLTNITTDGLIKGGKRVGGVVGSMDNNSNGGGILNCGNSATVICYGTETGVNYNGNNTGGIIGFSQNSIVNCFNTGYIYSTGGTNTGGIAGTLNSLGNSADISVSNSYSSGAVFGQSKVGGIVGDNLDSVHHVSVSGYVSSSKSTVGAILGANGSAYAITYNAFYDTELSQINNSIGSTSANSYVGTITALNTSDYNKESTFSFSFGDSEVSPWKMNTNTYGRPYLYWQEAAVSNPFPTHQSVGVDVLATYLGTLETQDPATPEITNKGMRVTVLDENYLNSWDGEEGAWYYIYTDSVSGTTFSAIQDEIFENRDMFLVQPFVVAENGMKVYGDMTKMDARYFLAILTHNDSERLETSTTLNGEIYKATDVTEYGFIYSKESKDILLDSISAGSSTVEHIMISVDPSETLDASPNDVFLYDKVLASGSLDHREAYYMRFYAIDITKDTVYGETKRFITEKRDFSLNLDGHSALMVDATSTNSFINDWGTNGETFSVDFWVKNENGFERQGLLSNLTDTTGYSLFINTHGKITLNYAPSKAAASTDSIDDSNWHHVAMVYSTGSLQLYIDGKVSDRNITLIRPEEISTNLIIGAENGPSSYLTGKMDALHFWNVALTEEQVRAVAYDNLVPSENGKIMLKGSGKEISDLEWNNLTASIGFNVMSTFTEANSDVPTIYETESEGMNYPFFPEEGKEAFNLIAIGSPRPSVYLSRSNWSYVANSEEWLDDENWTSSAYPGRGIGDEELSLYQDVTDSEIIDSGDYCQNTIINKVSTGAHQPKVDATPPFLLYLIDNDEEVETYSVDNRNNAILQIRSGIAAEIFHKENAVITNDNATIEIESGSMEIH